MLSDGNGSAAILSDGACSVPGLTGCAGEDGDGGEAMMPWLN